MRDFSGSVLLPHTLFPSLRPSPLRTWHSGTHGTISTRALQRGDTPEGWLALHGPSYVTHALLIQDSWRFSSQLRAQFNTCLRYIPVSKSQRQFRKVQETNLHKGSGLHCLEPIFFFWLCYIFDLFWSSKFHLCPTQILWTPITWQESPKGFSLLQPI